MTDVEFDRTMSDTEALMWRLEDDPYLSSTFGSVTILDRAPDFDAFRRRMDRASRLIPGLRQRVAAGPIPFAPPVWEDDPDFSLDRHVRRIACPEPGDLRQVLDLATLIVADPFDRKRPLWQFVVIEGMHDGRAAVVQKMHHTITDGERGVQLSLQYLDFERDAPEPPALTDAAPPDTDEHDHDPIREIVAGGLRLPVGVIKQVRDLLADTEPARSPLWTERSLARRLDVLQVPFRATKDAAGRLGGTLNTAFLAAAAHAAGDYHDRLGAPVESLRASMAISVRTESSGSNAFALARLDVPTEPMHIIDRFRLVEESVEAVRANSGAAGLGALAAVTAALPTPVITRLARQQAETIDFATSNVKGSPAPMYIAGAKMEAVYPAGPLAGVAFNLTLLSYLGQLDLGLHMDTAAIAEPDLLTECLDRAFRDFNDA